jgi:hypothetical protein
MDQAPLRDAEERPGVALPCLTTLDLERVGIDPGASVGRTKETEPKTAGSVERILIVKTNQAIHSIESFHDRGLIQTPKVILHREPLDSIAT